MLEKGRLNQIMDSLRQHHNLTVTEISKQLYVSEATVRRDLTRLEQMGFIKRVYGGAVLLGNAQSEPPLVLRARQNAQPKIQIAAEAARYLRNGQTIFLDASSTVMHLVKHLEELQSITIVTNGLKTAIELQPLYQPHGVLYGRVPVAQFFRLRGRLCRGFHPAVQRGCVFLFQPWRVGYDARRADYGFL